MCASVSTDPPTTLHHQIRKVSVGDGGFPSLYTTQRGEGPESHFCDFVPSKSRKCHTGCFQQCMMGMFSDDSCVHPLFCSSMTRAKVKLSVRVALFYVFEPNQFLNRIIQHDLQILAVNLDVIKIN